MHLDTQVYIIILYPSGCQHSMCLIDSCAGVTHIFILSIITWLSTIITLQYARADCTIRVWSYVLRTKPESGESALKSQRMSV